MVTVFAGGPPAVDPLPWWDRRCGVVEPGDDVVGIRRAEDLAAAGVLSATVRHLDHWDNQYRGPTYGYREPDAGLVEAIVADLELLLDEVDLDRWLVPLGILHPDHRAAATASCAVAARHPDVEWLVYEDLPYATLYRRDRQLALDGLPSRGFGLQAVPVDLTGEASSVREAAVRCYRSQLRGLGPEVGTALATPERIHRLTRR